MIPEDEKSILKLLLDRKNQSNCIEEKTLQKIEMISMLLEKLRSELDKLDATNDDRLFI